jgi:hypothetical protein
MVRRAVLMTTWRRRRIRNAVLSATKVFSCVEKAFWKAVTSPVRTADCQLLYACIMLMSLTLDDLEVRRKRLLQDGFSEHCPIRDLAGKKGDNDEEFVDLMFSAHSGSLPRALTA